MFHKLYKWITTKETPETRDKNYRMAQFLSLLLGVQGYVMVIISIISHDPMNAIVPACYGTLMLLVFIHTTFSQKLVLFYTSIILMAFFLEYKFLMTGGSNGFGVIWFLIIPLFSVYLINQRYFHLVNGVFMIILMLAMWSPIHNYIYPFETSFRIRFPLVYLLEFLFSIFLKYRITKTENELKQQKDLLSREIQQATLIQNAFFKQHITEFMDWSLGICNSPMAGVSGDLYDSYSKGADLDGIGIFDVSGHGISSGLITMLIKNTVNHEFYRDLICPLSKTLERINRRFLAEKGDIENYFTGILLRINDSDIEFVNAGHHYPVLYKKSTNTFETINRAPEAFGAVGLKNITPVFVSQHVKMESGDEIVLFTDGAIDTVNEKDEKFGHERLLESLKNHITEAPKLQVNKILEDIKAFQNTAAPIDDITIMILRKD